MNDERKDSYNNEVADTRKLVIGREHSALLIWGISSASIALLIYLIQFFTGDYYWWLWIALPVIAGPIHSAVDKKNDKKYAPNELTPLYQLLGRVSKITISIIFVTSMLTFAFNFNAYFVILLILTFWCGLSGYILDYSRLIQFAAVGLVMSIAVRVHEASGCVLLWFALGLIVLLLMPGLDMYKRSTTKQFK